MKQLWRRQRLRHTMTEEWCKDTMYVQAWCSYYNSQ